MIKKLLIAFSILLIATTSYCATNWAQFSYFKNSLGLNDAFSPIAIADGEASDLQNVVFTVSGSFKKRSGFTETNGFKTGATTGIKYIKFSDGTRYLIGVFADDKIYKMDYGSSGPDGTWDNITGALSFAVGQNNLASFTIGQDTLIIEDGLNTTTPFMWTNGAAAALALGDAPNATVVAFHKNMAFCGGNNTNPSTLYFSDLGDVDNFSTGLAGNVNVETNDGSIIRALVPGFDALYIFKDYSIFRLTGSDKDSFQLQKMVSGVGVTSPQAVSLIGNQFFIITGQGNVYIYDGAVGLTLISSKIAGTLKTDLSYSRYAYASSLTYDTDYYLSVSTASSGDNDLVLMFDTFNMAWTKFSGMDVNAWTVADDGAGRDKIFFGDYHGTACKYPQGDNDNGAAIDAYWVSKQFDYPELGPTKDFKMLKVYVAEEPTAYNLTVTTLKDFATTGTDTSVSLNAGVGGTYGTAVYGTDVYGGETIITPRIEPNLDGTFYQVKFRNANKDEPFEVYGFQNYVERQDRY